jgi:hypothetical protein
MTEKKAYMILEPEPGLTWRRSSFSGGGGGGCVEVAWPEPLVAVRDSKHLTGPTLAFPRETWSALRASVQGSNSK